MSSEEHVEGYHTYKIQGRRINPTLGDFERWWFEVSRDDAPHFALEAQMSRTLIAQNRWDGHASSAHIRDTGLRHIHGLIDLGTYRQGETMVLSLSTYSEKPTAPPDREVPIYILKVLKRIRQLNPTHHKYETFDVVGFCTSLGIERQTYLDSVMTLLDHGFAAETDIQQEGIEKGAIYITSQGAIHLDNLEKVNTTKIDRLRISIDDIDSFAAVRQIAPGSIEAVAPGGYLNLSEEAIQISIEKILFEPYHAKDWGGEINDLFTHNLVVDGKRVVAAFLLKGNGLRREMRLADCGKNGDQILRLFESPAELYVIQYVGVIGQDVVRDVEGKVQLERSRGRRAQYCIINGQDTARLLAAYGLLT